MDRTPEELELMCEALAREPSAGKPLTVSEQFALLLGPGEHSAESDTTVPEPRKQTATEGRTGLHIVDRKDKFMRGSVVSVAAKKPTDQD
jgi:hypothetical protein